MKGALDHLVGRPDSGVARPRGLTVSRERGQVLLHQRPERVGVEVPHQHKGESGGRPEPGSVEIDSRRRVDLTDYFRADGPAPGMMLGQSNRKSVLKGRVGAGAPVGQGSPHVTEEGGNRAGIEPRRGEVQPHQLEQDLGIARGSLSAQPVLVESQVGSQADRLAGQFLLKVHRAPLSHPAHVHELGREAGRLEQRIGGERNPAGARSLEQDLVGFEVGGPQNNGSPVVQLPLGRLQHRVPGFRYDPARRGRGRDQVSIGHGFYPGRNRPPLHLGEESEQAVGAGHRGPVLFRSVDQDYRSAALEPAPCDRVNFGPGNPGQLLLGPLEFVAHPGNSVPGKEMIHVVSRERFRFGLFPLGVGLLQRAQVVAPDPLQFGIGEPVAAGPLDFGENRFEPPLDPRVGHHRTESEGVGAPDQAALPGAGPDERRVGFLSQLPEPLIEHAGGQVLQETPAPFGDGTLRSRFPHQVNRQTGSGGLGVAGNRNGGLAARRHPGLLPGVAVGGGREYSEPVADNPLDRALVEVAHRNHRHEGGAVPGTVESPQRLGRTLLDAVGRPDGKPLGVSGAAEQNRQVLIQHTLSRAAAQPPFLQHHSPLLPDLGGVEGDSLGPVLENLERPGQDLGLVGGDLKLVYRFVEAGVGVQVGPEPHPDGLDVVDELLLGEVAGPVEGHVLHEVGQAALVFLFLNRAGIHHQAKLGPVQGPAILPDVVAEPVGKPPDGYRGIDRKEGIGLGRPGGRGTEQKEREYAPEPPQHCFSRLAGLTRGKGGQTAA